MRNSQYANLRTVSSLVVLIFLFSLINQSFITQAPVAVATENAADDDIAMVYRGSSDDGHKYCFALENAPTKLG